MTGYIKVYRQLLDNPIVCKDADHLAIWVYILLQATHTEYDAVFRGERITLQRGQLLTGRKSIASKLCIDESKVKRILIEFENDQQIDRQRSNQNSLITVKNWDAYQSRDQQNDQKVTSKRPASDQPVTTNKNVKNIKNDKNVRNIYTIGFASFWSSYPKKKSKPEAEKAWNKLKPDDALLATILKAIDAQKKTDGWTKDVGKFIPHPATWLNGRRWEDEVIPASPKITQDRSFERKHAPGAYDHLAIDPFAGTTG